MIFISILIFIPNKSLAAEYQINTFDGDEESDNALINRKNTFISNDIAEFVANVTATSNINTKLPSITLTLNGNGYKLAGNSHNGISLTSGANYTVNNLEVSDFNTNNGGFINIQSSTGAPATSLNIIESVIKNNTAVNNGGAIYNINSQGYINNSSFESNSIISDVTSIDLAEA